MRWSEEVELLQEEMGRVLRFLDWQAQWWIGRARGRGEDLDGALQEGLTAYACRQALIRIQIKEKFMTLWQPVDLWVEGKAGNVLENASDEEGGNDEQEDCRIGKHY